MAVAESFAAVRYRCPFCRRSWSSKSRANAHVAICWHDPGNRTCKTCVNHVPAEIGYCGARAGCQCQNIEEHCLAGVDMTEQVFYLDGDEPGPPKQRTEIRVQVGCENWVPS